MRRLLPAALAVLAIAAPVAMAAGGGSLGQLGSQLSATQTQESSLSTSLQAIQQEVSQLEGQIELLQSREAAVRAALDTDEARLADARVALRRERQRIVVLRRRLKWAQHLLANQLVSSYERPGPTLISIVLAARGFDDLLQNVAFLDDAERAQQRTIALTTAAKHAAATATVRLTQLRDGDQLATNQTATEAAALAGMNSLLASRQDALGDARAAQETALAAAQTRGAQLKREIATVQAEQAAAARAAALRAQDSYVSGAALGPSGGWAIPYAIVLCESGGQNLPPNSAGASGYYQIVPGTWRQFGGGGPAAYLAPKAEQDAVAARIWNGGAGASSWVCAGLVGIT